MHYCRIHANGVLLPDGKVCAVGGMSSHANATGDLPVLPVEMYDPKSDQWTLMAKPQRPRVYHSTALLLPDARVISMGGNPQARVIERSIEIFSPPYLFQGERPLILDHFRPPVFGSASAKYRTGALEVAAWENRRNQHQATVDWQFTNAKARSKLEYLYPSIS